MTIEARGHLSSFLCGIRRIASNKVLWQTGDSGAFGNGSKPLARSHWLEATGSKPVTYRMCLMRKGDLAYLHVQAMTFPHRIL